MASSETICFAPGSYQSEFDADEELSELEEELQGLTATLEMAKIDFADASRKSEDIKIEEIQDWDSKESTGSIDSTDPGDFSPSSRIAADASSSDMGWRIARQAMVRDFLFLAGRSFVGIALVGLLAFASYHLYKASQSIKPEALTAGFYRVFPALKPHQPVFIDEVKADKSDKNTAEPEKKAVRKERKRKIARKGHNRVKVAKRYNYSPWAGDHPSGGEITYTDGTITEYTWY
ncbi:MAG: hypothetical protein K2Y32_09515 [Candidatus Obscuribacterales bacterium]|nr:hypothetical protein [Candidatus Obscuribacterales bacterium]